MYFTNTYIKFLLNFCSSENLIIHRSHPCLNAFLDLKYILSVLIFMSNFICRCKYVVYFFSCLCKTFYQRF